MIKIENEDEAAARLESALYSAGRPLSIEELIRASGTESRPKTMVILESIIKKTKNAFRAIEIVILPDGNYVFQLKPEYSSSVRKYASKPILAKATRKHYRTLYTRNQLAQNNFWKLEDLVFMHT